MAQLTTFMYANESRTEVINGQSNHTINNPLLSIKPAFIPGQLSFAVIFGITDFDFNENHTFQFRLIAPDKTVTVDTGIIQIPPTPPEQDGSKLDGFIGSFDLRNVVFMIEGKYKNEVKFDNIMLREDEILVKGAGINGSHINQL